MHASSWQSPSRIPTLDTGAIHVWRANMEALAQQVDALGALVSADERARGEAFHAAVDRTRHLVTRGVLRTLVGHYVSALPTAVRFEIGTFGKPTVAPPHHTRLSFNVSHSGNIVLLAFARVGELGVDVEQWSPRLGELDRTRIGESVFSGAERAAIQGRSSAAEREAAFYSLWSRKEAYLKGTGAGISGGLAHVHVSTDATARLIEDGRDPLAVQRWALLDIDVGVGYSAALAHSPPGQEVVLLALLPRMLDG